MKLSVRCVSALALALLTLIPFIFTGCGNDKDNGDMTTPAQQSQTTAAATEKTDNLPAINMEGFTLAVLNYTDKAHSFSLKTLDCAEMSGDTLGDAIYERNRNIEERFNAVITEIQTDTFVDALTKSVTAGDAVYDLALCYDRKVNLVNTSGLITTWDNLPYIDLSAEWWNQDANMCFRINDKQFAAVGDFSLSMYSKSYVFFLNKNLYGKVGSVPELYQLVRDGKWTDEKMLGMMKLLDSDLDGNGFDKNDQYGIEGATKVYFQMLLTGTGIKLVDTDSTGNPYFALPDNERAIDVILKIVNMHVGINTFYNYSPNSANAGIQGDEFKAGRVGLLAGTMWDYEDFKGVDFALGILPSPKLTELQEGYYTPTMGGVVSVIPMNIPEERADKTGILIEALSFYSREKLLPIYKEVILQSKYSDTEDDSDMIDIIFNSQTYDLGCLVWNDEIRLPLMTNIFHTLNTNIASFLQTVTPSINSTIQKTIDALK